MADNTRGGSQDSGDPLIATDEVTYSGETADVQLVRVVGVTGAEGSKTVTDINVSAAGLDINVAGQDNPLFVTGDVAHDFADSGSPVKIGGKASAGPTAVASNDRVNAWFGPRGQIVVGGVNVALSDTEGGNAVSVADVASSGNLPLWTYQSIYSPSTDNWHRVRTVGTVDGVAVTGIAAAGLMGYNGTTWDRVRVANTGRLQVDVVTAPSSATAGDVAHDAADSGNPVKIGGKTKDILPTPVAIGDRTDAWFDTRGALLVTLHNGSGNLISGYSNNVDAVGNIANATALPTASFSYVFNGTNWDRARSGGVTGMQGISGDTAHDAVDGGNPVKIGGRATGAGESTGQTAVADLDRVNAAFDVNGKMGVFIGDPGQNDHARVGYASGDGLNNAANKGLWTNAKLVGFNGTTWDRIRTIGGLPASDANTGIAAVAVVPHKTGYTQWFAGADITTATTTNIKTPTAGKKLVITKVTIGTGGTTAGLVTVWLAASGDTTVNLNTDDVLFRGVLTPTANATPGVILDFPTNPPIGTADFLLKVTTAAASTVYVTARGYEV
jgi:hypothetical protein